MTTPSIIAHRGFAGVFPENTIAAATGAVEAGTDMIEVDVMPTGDGDVVVFHDDRLDDSGHNRGITDGEGVVWDQPTDVVTGAHVLGTDETVPLLRSVLEAVPASVGLNVELKNPGSKAIKPAERLVGDARVAAVNRWTPFVKDVIAVTDTYPNEILFSSFCEGALGALAEHDATARLAVLLDRDDWTEGTAIARAYDVDAIHVPVTQCRNEVIAGVATELDAAINVWTIRNERAAIEAVDAGADGLIAEYPGLPSGDTS